MGEMNVADNVVNVDYYDEAKFADAAAAVARTARRTVELTALKAWRDHASDATGGGYLDSITATEKYGLASQMGYICTGGGALIRFLTGEELPVVKALRHGAELCK